jgi:hypothetical protein
MTRGSAAGSIVAEPPGFAVAAPKAFLNRTSVCWSVVNGVAILLWNLFFSSNRSNRGLDEKEWKRSIRSDSPLQT